jgi:thioredoxin 1
MGEILTQNSKNDLRSQNFAEIAAQPNRVKFNFWRWFWIATLVVSLPYVWYCFYVPTNNIAWAADFNSAQEKASQTGKPIILFFTGKWCVPCRIMKRNVWADEQVTTSVNGSFIPVTIDVDDPGSTATRSRYNVGTTPKTIITDPQGKVLQQVDGGIGKTDFLKILRKLNPIAGEPRFAP